MNYRHKTMSSVLSREKKGVLEKRRERGCRNYRCGEITSHCSWRGLGSGEMNDGRNVNEMGMELQ